MPMTRLALPAFALAALLAAGAAAGGEGKPAESAEHEIKAAFLLNFTKFVTWPDKAFEKPESPFVIGILGQDPFGATLDKMFEGKTFKDRKIEIRRFSWPERKGPDGKPREGEAAPAGDEALRALARDLKACHLLFVCSSEEPRLPELAGMLKGAPVLTVGESEDFAKRLGVIGFFIEAKKVRFQINTDAAARAQLEISSRLLRLASVVHD
jgi:hypothetical protein